MAGKPREKREADAWIGIRLSVSRPFLQAVRRTHQGALNLAGMSAIIRAMKRIRSALLCLGAMGLAISSGCGREAPPKQPTSKTATTPAENGTTEKPAAPKPSESEPEKPQAGTSSDARTAARTDSKGRKWLGDIPYDVWFDDPLSVVGTGIESTAAGKSAPSSKPNMEAVGEPAASAAKSSATKTENPAAAGDGTAVEEWKQLVSADVLDAEVKSIRNSLAAALQSVGKYNAKYKDVQMMGSTLAAIGEIAAEHPDSIRWKANARHLREIGAAIEQSADKTGGEAFQATRKSFESLVGLLDGNGAASLAEPPARGGFSEFADRGGLMKRIEVGFGYLKKDINAEKALASNAEKSAHEAALVAALGRVIAEKGYPSADEAEYAGHAKAFIENAAEMKRAAAAGDFSKFVEARDRVQIKCDECHKVYRF